MQNLQTRIYSVKLTKTHQMIANYILDYSSDACFLTSTEIANTVGVSESSVIRFSKIIGYKGFMDFQKALRQEYQDNIYSISNEVTVPAKRISKYNSIAKTVDIGNVHYKNALHNIESAFNKNPRESIEKAASLIIGSKRKYIIATRSNVCLGDYTLFYLNQILPHVEFSSHGPATPIDTLCHITKDDCAIFFSFPRYSTLDKLAAQMAASASAKIIVITDKFSADLAPYADLVLIAPIDSNAFFNSLISAQFLVELLCNTISQKVRGVEKRLKKIDIYLNELGNY